MASTVEVAALSYGIPLRDAEPLIRDMLGDHRIPGLCADRSPETAALGSASALRLATS